MGKRHIVRRWRQWTEEQARGALEEFAASGESAAAFARRRGISTRRLAYWRKRLPLKRLPQGTKTEFVAVTLPTSSSARWIEISTGTVVIRVAEDLDVDHVARLVEAIGRRGAAWC